MTKSILNDCLLLKDKPTSELEYYFDSIALHIFEPIFRYYRERHESLEFESKNTILFILCAYSEDSPLVILRRDATEEKNAICEYLGIPEMYRNDLINLVTYEVRQAVTEYLEQFAGAEFKNLMFMKIQLNDWERALTNREFGVVDKDGNKTYDIKEHSKAVTETRRLAKNIEVIEKELKSRTKYLGLDEVKLWKNKGDKKIRTGSRKANMEDSEFIK